MHYSQLYELLITVTYGFAVIGTGFSASAYRNRAYTIKRKPIFTMIIDFRRLGPLRYFSFMLLQKINTNTNQIIKLRIQV